MRGKRALCAYWNAALAPIGTLRFTVDGIMWDPDTRELAIVYVSEIDGRVRRVSENLTFGADGLVVSAEVFHGIEAASRERDAREGCIAPRRDLPLIVRRAARPALARRLRWSLLPV